MQTRARSTDPCTASSVSTFSDDDVYGADHDCDDHRIGTAADTVSRKDRCRTDDSSLDSNCCGNDCAGTSDQNRNYGEADTDSDGLAVQRGACRRLCDDFHVLKPRARSPEAGRSQ